jgi:tRNA (guanine37-N1)-methyltransferase
VKFDVVTLFPEMVEQSAKAGVVGRAFEAGILQLGVWNPRDYTTDKHRTVDDRPYGGGPGMVMKPEPLAAALQDVAKNGKAKVVYMSPQGKPLTHELAKALSKSEHVVLLCGRYEGVDQRVLDTLVDEEISIGDYVLSGGELAALVVMDAVGRLVPEVLGDKQSAEQDSFSDGLLDCPHYTRPEQYEGQSIPEVLKSGNHQAIEAWRYQTRVERTQVLRPDLIDNCLRAWPASSVQGKRLRAALNEIDTQN